MIAFIASCGVQRQRVDGRDSTQLVAVRGEVDLATVDALRGASCSSALGRSEKVVLDLREVSFMDTQGLAAVIEAGAGLGRLGHAVSSSCARPRTVHRLFDMIGLSDRLTVVDDPAAA